MAGDGLHIAFVGHTGHGKSTLIGRLLHDTAGVGNGTDLAHLVDHLAEERDGGGTLDTTQAVFVTPLRHTVAIDAPGNRALLAQMLTGTSQAEAAVLVVDAERGLDEQTRRHALLLHLLGVGACVVAVNKMDLVARSAARFEALRAAVERLLRARGLTMAACVPASATCGDNVVAPSDAMPWYDGATLLEAIEAVDVVADEDRPARFVVQDAYGFDGEPIAVGRVEAGGVDEGDELLVLPDARRARVVAIRRFHSRRTVAEVGECVGLVLSQGFVARRGQVLCDPAAPSRVATRLRVRLFWLADGPLVLGESLAAGIATQHASARVEAIRCRADSATLEVLEAEATQLHATEVADVELSLAQPLVVEAAAQCPALGRVVLDRDGVAVGAGVVLADGWPAA